MIRRYRVLETRSVTTLSANNGSPVAGPIFQLHHGDFICVDPVYVMQHQDQTLHVAPNTICLIDTLITQGPIPSSTGIFTDQAVPVGVLEGEDETEV